jgi:hypothetical protein
VVIHRWNEKDLRCGGEEARSQEVVGETMCGTTNKVGGSGGDDDNLRCSCKLYVVESVARTEDLSVHGPSSHCFEGDWSDEFSRGARHYDVYFRPSLCKQTRQPH